MTGSPPGPGWRQSSHSTNNGQCVEVAVVPSPTGDADYRIAVRDSKDREGPVLNFTPGNWQEFTSLIKVIGA